MRPRAAAASWRRTVWVGGCGGSRGPRRPQPLLLTCPSSSGIGQRSSVVADMQLHTCWSRRRWCPEHATQWGCWHHRSSQLLTAGHALQSMRMPGQWTEWMHHRGGAERHAHSTLWRGLGCRRSSCSFSSSVSSRLLPPGCATYAGALALPSGCTSRPQPPGGRAGGCRLRLLRLSPAPDCARRRGGGGRRGQGGHAGSRGRCNKQATKGPAMASKQCSCRSALPHLAQVVLQRGGKLAHGVRLLRGRQLRLDRLLAGPRRRQQLSGGEGGSAAACWQRRAKARHRV